MWQYVHLQAQSSVETTSKAAIYTKLLTSPTSDFLSISAVMSSTSAMVFFTKWSTNCLHQTQCQSVVTVYLGLEHFGSGTIDTTHQTRHNFQQAMHWARNYIKMISKTKCGSATLYCKSSHCRQVPSIAGSDVTSCRQ